MLEAYYSLEAVTIFFKKILVVFWKKYRDYVSFAKKKIISRIFIKNISIFFIIYLKYTILWVSRRVNLLRVILSETSLNDGEGLGF